MAPEKLFTPAEAGRMLPLVRSIVADIMATGAKLKALPGRPASPAERESEARLLTARLQSHMAELEQLGCQFKDWNFEIGLVDFPGVVAGEKVLLCWRADEPDVRFYHRPGEGYAARRPLPVAAPAG